jgi:hypothetical protein
MSKRLPPEFGEQQPEEKKDRALTRRDFVKIAGAAGAAAAAGGVLPNVVEAAPKPPVTTPAISCEPNGTDGSAVIDVKVCAPAGGTGLPAGFSVQWMTCADFEANGNAWLASDDSRLCKASFSGNAQGSTYNLTAGTCLTVHVGNFTIDNQQGYSSSCEGPLDCDTCYVFRAFGHATNTLNRSAFTANCESTTDECPAQNFVGCTKSKGYFGNRGITDTTTACALGYYAPGGITLSNGQNFDTVVEIDDFMPGQSSSGRPPNHAGSNPLQQELALALNIALSAAECTNYCTCVTTDPDGFPGSGDEVTTCDPYPAGFGAAVLCGIVDLVTPLGASGFFPTGSAALLNGKTVLGVLTGTAASFGLTAAQYGELCATLNLSFHGNSEDEGCTCEPSSFGSTHLFVGSCPAPA